MSNKCYQHMWGVGDRIDGAPVTWGPCPYCRLSALQDEHVAVNRLLERTDNEVERLRKAIEDAMTCCLDKRRTTPIAKMLKEALGDE